MVCNFAAFATQIGGAVGRALALSTKKAFSVAACLWCMVGVIQWFWFFFWGGSWILIDLCQQLCVERVGPPNDQNVIVQSFNISAYVFPLCLCQCLFWVSLPRSLANKYVKTHAVRQRDVCRRPKGKGSWRKWLPSAMLRSASPGSGVSVELELSKY